MEAHTRGQRIRAPAGHRAAFAPAFELAQQTESAWLGNAGDSLGGFTHSFLTARERGLSRSKTAQ